MQSAAAGLPASVANLPALPRPPAREMAGPTPWCNWAIPGQVLAGAYPASMSDEETDRILTLLLELGVNTFVCLQAEVNIHIPEHTWRAGNGLRPYIRDAQRILSRAHEAGHPRITQQKIDFLHLPIIDGNVTTDSAMNRLAEDCCERVLRGEKMYIHCWGGHGRTGTLVAIMLSRLYCLPYTTALRYTQAFHDSREFPQGVRSPQTSVQRAQVRRLLMLPSSTTSAITSTIFNTSTGSSPGRVSTASAPLPAGSIRTAPSTSSTSALLTSQGPATPVKAAAVPSSLARFNINWQQQQQAQQAQQPQPQPQQQQYESPLDRLRTGAGKTAASPSIQASRPQVSASLGTWPGHSHSHSHSQPKPAAPLRMASTDLRLSRDNTLHLSDAPPSTAAALGRATSSISNSGGFGERQLSSDFGRLSAGGINTAGKATSSFAAAGLFGTPKTPAQVRTSTASISRRSMDVR